MWTFVPMLELKYIVLQVTQFLTFFDFYFDKNVKPARNNLADEDRKQVGGGGGGQTYNAGSFTDHRKFQNNNHHGRKNTLCSFKNFSVWTDLKCDRKYVSSQLRHRDNVRAHLWLSENAFLPSLSACLFSLHSFVMERMGKGIEGAIFHSYRGELHCNFVHKCLT